MRKRGQGETCTYCKRTLSSVRSPARVAATKDHVVAKAHGGKATVWSCRQCNSIKGSMTFDSWVIFMAAHPGWWTMPQFRKHGLAHKRRAKNKRERAEIAAAEILSQPSFVPKEYDDPLAQAAFEAVYRNRLHLLRVSSERSS